MKICIYCKAGKDRKHGKGLINLSEIRSEAVNKGHIEYAKHREGMLNPEGVISVMAKTKLFYNRRGSNGNKS